MDKAALLKRLEEVERVCADDPIKIKYLALAYLVEFVNDTEISEAVSSLGKFKFGK